MGIMHAMMATGRVMSREGHLRLIMNKHGKQQRMDKGMEAAALPFCLAFRGSIMFARAPDNLLYKLCNGAATGLFSLTIDSSSLMS
jgi:hypothetical protein